VKVLRKRRGYAKIFKIFTDFFPEQFLTMFKIWRPTPNSTKPSAKDSDVHCCQVHVELFGQIGKIRPLRNKTSILEIFLILWHFAELLAELGIKSKGGHTNFFG
jgi:hypothetical protein